MRSALLLTLIPFAATAQETTPAEPRAASKAEYLACLVQRDLIDRRTQSLQEQDEALKVHAGKFQAAEADLARQVKQSPPRTKKEIESYNRAVAARNKSAERFNEQGRSLQRDNHALNIQIIETNTTCGKLLVSAEIAAAAEEEFQSRTRPK